MTRTWMALLALVLLAGCSDAERTAPPAPPAAASPSPSPSPSSTATARPTPSASASTSATLSSAQAEATVRDLLGALGADMPRAWTLLTSRAQDSFGSQAKFQELESEYAEGLAAFADLPASTARVSAGTAVVVLAGEVTREGETDQDAVALPVRTERGRWRVELLSSASPFGRVERVFPESGATVRQGATLRATVPAAARTTVLLDGAVQPFRETPKDGDRVEIALTPALSAGPHLLLVVATRADGVLLAEAVLFTVR